MTDIIDPMPAVIPSGLQHLVAQAIAEVGGIKCSDLNGRRVILALRDLGVEVVYTSQVQRWGEIGNVCVYHETGAVCSFCRCSRRNG
jgi:hypothetical protein